MQNGVGPEGLFTTGYTLPSNTARLVFDLQPLFMSVTYKVYSPETLAVQLAVLLNAGNGCGAFHKSATTGKL